MYSGHVQGTERKENKGVQFALALSLSLVASVIVISKLEGSSPRENQSQRALETRSDKGRENSGPSIGAVRQTAKTRSGSLA